MRVVLVAVQTVGFALMPIRCGIGPLGDPSERERHCEVFDEWEPNPDAQHPKPMAWEQTNPGLVESRDVPAYLCAGEEDWYRFPTANLDYADPHLLAWSVIGDDPVCFATCLGPGSHPDPKQAMTVEIYRADTMQLLQSDGSEIGEVILLEPGAATLHDLLIRVYSPTRNAKFPYRLNAILIDGGPGDICEC